MRGLLIVLALMALAVGFGLAVLLVSTLWHLPQPSSEPVAPPLASLHVRHSDHTDQASHWIRAQLAPGYPLAASVNIAVFDGLDPYIKPEEVQRRLGPPSGFWRIPPLQARPEWEGTFDRERLDLDAPYYERPLGRVTMRPFPTPEQGPNWVPVAYPKDCTLAFLFPDERLRSQIAPHVASTGLTSLSIASARGPVALLVSLDRRGCRDLELRARDK